MITRTSILPVLVLLPLAAPSANADFVIFQDSFDAENGSMPAVNYNGFNNWTVEEGSVDLLGAGSGNILADVYPDNGLYVDLDGSTGAAATLRSVPLFLSTGSYVLEFDLGDTNFAFNQEGANTMSVTVGDLVSEQFSSADTHSEGLTLMSIPFEATTQGLVDIVFSHDGGDNLGLVIDNVRIVQIAGPGSAALAAVGILIALSRTRRYTA